MSILDGDARDVPMWASLRVPHFAGLMSPADAEEAGSPLHAT